MTAGTLATVFRDLCLSMGCTRPAGRCSHPATRSTNPVTGRPRLRRLRTLVWEPFAVVETVTAVVVAVAVHRIRPASPTNGICSLAMTVVASFDHGCGT